MKIIAKHQGHILAAVVVLLICLSLLDSRWARFFSQPPRQIVTLIISPLTRPLHALGSWVRGRDEPELDYGTDIAQLTHLLKQAQAQNANLKMRLDEAQHTIGTLTRMKGYLRFGGARLLPARVTQSTTDPAHPTLTIDRGERDGLYPGLVVASEFNLVGRITHVGHAHCTVALVMTPKHHVQVIIMPKLAGAMNMPGTETKVMAKVSKDGKLLEAVVPASSMIKPGYLTRLLPPEGNLNQGASGAVGAWPREAWGLVVGQVSKVLPDPTDPISRKLVEIRPLHWPYHLTEVVVVAPRSGHGQVSASAADAQGGSY